VLLQFKVTAYQVKCSVVSCSVLQRGHELMLDIRESFYTFWHLDRTAKVVQNKRGTNIWEKMKEEMVKARVCHGAGERKHS